MSIFSALTTSMSGLRAQSFALEAISDNIANAQTLGYKRADASFEDMVLEGPVSQQMGGSVAATSRSFADVAGSVRSSGVATNFALSGPGFVAVRDRLNTAGGQAIFSATNAFTRRGDFTLDKDGYLVNGSGSYLVGSALNPLTGQQTGAAPDVIRVAASTIPARASTTLTYAANLPATPKTNAYDPNVAGSELWAAGAAAPAQVTQASTPSAKSLVDNSISGQSVRFYDAVGLPVDVDMRWAKLSTGANGSTWGLYACTTQGTTPETSTWSLATTATFDSAGQLTPAALTAAVDLTSRGLGTVNFDLGNGKMTQYADNSGQAQVRATQDGYGAGAFSSLTISDTGRVIANFTNGQTQSLAQITIAQFNAPGMLKRTSGGMFEETLESGAPLFNGSTTTLMAGSVEGSNTDIADEFSKMIVTQQAYSANTRVVSASQDMLKEIINVIR
ncbi:MAG: flagellar hook-basal body complex protein [Alsobacter sp.]